MAGTRIRSLPLLALIACGMLLQSIPVAVAIKQCPPGQEEVDCTCDPCILLSCPNHPEAYCEQNYCGGCGADFYQGMTKLSKEDCFGTRTTPKPITTPTTKPTTKIPITKIPITKEPTTRQPTTKKPTTKEPTTRQPTTKEPTTRQPTTKRPTTKKPTTKKPTTKKPTTKKPTTRQPIKPVTPIPTSPPKKGLFGRIIDFKKKVVCKVFNIFRFKKKKC